MTTQTPMFHTERRNGIVLSLTQAQRGAPQTEAYAGYLLSQRHRPAGRYLFAADAFDLVGRKAMIVTARRSGPAAPQSPVGGCYFTLQEGVLWLRGLIVGDEVRGRALAPAMVSFGIRGLLALGPGFESGAGAVIAHHGSANPNSVRALAKLGYALSGEDGITELDGGFRNRHLFAYAERIDGVLVTRYRMLRLPQDRIDQAAGFIETWTH
ncbi:hypothetical protein [Mesobacterium pallidum]|uniref:hypothetical protein n=1 Tax=Mesobacterium pallidum TaxID=2872037 RepID=UPI001EE36211|nr:hypothetical protein [Mesobacterium pallidum]